MSNTKKTTKRQKSMIAAAIAVVLGIVTLLLFINPFAEKPPSNSGLYPQNGSYKILEVQDVQCTLSDPPTCSGKLILSDEDPTRLEAQIGPDTKIRYQSKEIIIYPPGLEEGMTGQVTFKPGSATIETIVIAD